MGPGGIIVGPGAQVGSKGGPGSPKLFQITGRGIQMKNQKFHLNSPVCFFSTRSIFIDSYTLYKVEKVLAFHLGSIRSLTHLTKNDFLLFAMHHYIC